MIKSSLSHCHRLSLHCQRHMYSLSRNSLCDCPINLHVGKHPYFPFCCALALAAKFWTSVAFCLLVGWFDKESYLGTEAWSASLPFPEIYALWWRHLTTLVIAFMCYERDSCSWCSHFCWHKIFSFSPLVVSHFLLKGPSKSIILKCLPLVLRVTTGFFQCGWGITHQLSLWTPCRKN